MVNNEFGFIFQQNVGNFLWWERCLIVLSRFGAYYAACACIVGDLARWVFCTATSFAMFRRRWEHVAALISIISTSLRIPFTIPFGYLPEVCRHKSFLGPLSPGVTLQGYGGGAAGAREVIARGQLKGEAFDNQYVFNLVKTMPCALMALEKAVDNTDLEALKVFVKEGKVDPNITDTFGRSALKRAIWTSKKESVKTLLKLGADPLHVYVDETYKNIFFSTHNYPTTSPIRSAIQVNRIAIVKLMMNHVPDPNVLGADRISLLAATILKDGQHYPFLVQMAEHLIRRGCTLYDRDLDELRHCLALYIQKKYAELDQILIENQQRPACKFNSLIHTFYMACHDQNVRYSSLVILMGLPVSSRIYFKLTVLAAAKLFNSREALIAARKKAVIDKAKEFRKLYLNQADRQGIKLGKIPQNALAQFLS